MTPSFWSSVRLVARREVVERAREKSFLVSTGLTLLIVLGVVLVPPALGLGVRNAWEITGGVPIFVTENGVATADDARRIDYTTGALAGLHAAMDDGVQVLGYLHWSALDNYEWGSYRPTFGLIAVDRETFVRTPKPSLAWLGGIARSNELTNPASPA